MPWSCFRHGQLHLFIIRTIITTGCRHHAVVLTNKTFNRMLVENPACLLTRWLHSSGRIGIGASAIP